MEISSRSRQPPRPTWPLNRLVERRAELLLHSHSAGTQITYQSALQSYLTFCAKHDFPTNPTPDTLSFYITYMATYIKPSSIASYLSGVVFNLKPYYPHVLESRRHPMVQNTLQGALRLVNTPVKRKRAITTTDLRLVMALDASTHDDLLFCALVVTGFFGLLRPSELCFNDSLRKRDVRKLMFRHLVTFDKGSLSIPLHAHKADQQQAGNTVLLIRRDDDLNPLPIIQRYLLSRDTLFPLNPELWSRSDGSIPRYSWFIGRLKSALPGNIGGSSLRSGGADHLARLGTDPALIQACGRWASDAYKVYLRTHPALVHHLLTHQAAATISRTLPPLSHSTK